MTDKIEDQIPQDEALPKDNIEVAKNDKELEELVSNMPNVVPDAVAASQEKEQQAQATQKAAVDRKGRPFNPDLHAVDDQGNPVFTPMGAFKKKLRIPGKQQTGSLNIPQDAGQSAPDMRIKLAAAKLADIFIITGISFFGDDWKPEISKELNERDMLIQANERWMLENGLIEPPAWIDLLLVYGLYTGKRIAQAKPDSKIKVMIGKVKTFGFNLWLKITGQKVALVPKDK